ncbi:hypothetical protein G3M54_00715 [Bacillus megaterium NBRC 15308 = ATCC 14581]|nr:hypothetical protein [Priestia megaterium NBRC 15308 = ATCC 14581]
MNVYIPLLCTEDLEEGSLNLGEKAKINAYWQVNHSLRIHHNFLAGCDSRYLILNPQGAVAQKNTS